MQQMILPQQEWLQKIADGDEQAFYQLFVEFSPKVRPFLRKYSHKDCDIEELIQETFIRVWLYRDRLPEVINLRAWIFRIATGIYLNQVRKTVNNLRKIRNAWQGDSDMNTPLHQLQAEEVKEVVQQALQRMPVQRRKIFRLSREAGLKPIEIADKLGIPVGTVKNNLSAALKEIRKGLEAAGHDPLILIFLIVQLP